jgi:hypothetical protein
MILYHIALVRTWLMINLLITISSVCKWDGMLAINNNDTKKMGVLCIVSGLCIGFYMISENYWITFVMIAFLINRTLKQVFGCGI